MKPVQSNYYQRRLEKFINLKEKEDNPKVLECTDDYIEQLKFNVESNRIREE